MTDPMTVIKVGGQELDDPAFVTTLCTELAQLDRRITLVHGGGKEISAAMDRFGQTVRFVEGLRVTPPESMAIMEMVVCGSINKRIVATLVALGRAAIGLSGVDLGLVRCVPYRPGGLNLERVGETTHIDTTKIQTLLELNWLPVLAPVGLGQDDNLTYNINADHFARAIAAALANESTGTVPVELVFVSNVPGVVIDGEIVPKLAAADIEPLIHQGIITNGMIPKVRSALAALDAGVSSVRITNLKGLVTSGSRIV
jgi:acetylglutamate kinase